MTGSGSKASRRGTAQSTMTQATLFRQTTLNRTQPRRPNLAVDFPTQTPRPSGIQRPPFSIGPGENRGVVCAVCCDNTVERRVGLAFVNIPIAEAVLTTVADTQLYPRTIHKMQMMEASRILMPPTPADAEVAGLALRPLVEDELRGVPVVEVPARGDWSHTQGLEDLRHVAFAADLPGLEFAAQDSPLALAAFAALVRHLRDDFAFEFGRCAVRVRYQPPADVMMISVPTIRSLELLQNAKTAASKDCLYGLLNRTTTPTGARLLRSNIVQPSTQASVLDPRYDAVGELVGHGALLEAVQAALRTLKPLGDVEQVLTKLVILPKDGSVYESEQAINNILKLKSFLLAVPAVFDALGPATGPLLSGLRETCCPARADALLDTIAATIDDCTAYATKPLELRNQRVHTVRTAISASLDVQRRLYEDFSGQIHDYVNELEAELGVRVHLKYTAARRFFLSVRAADVPDGLPPVLINATRTRGNVECQTLHLVGLNERINQAVHGAMAESDAVIKGLLGAIRPQVATLFKYCESIALLDLLAGFAVLARTLGYTRPVLHDDAHDAHDAHGVHGLAGARHPILDARGRGQCIPNDYFVAPESRFQIITGQNMSGKSTYIRAMAMLQIMAQVGSFVPADSARLPVLHSLFARVSTDDAHESNLSTFSVEMREMAFILRNVGARSLVIVDELGRATSTRDGLGIATAVAEALLQARATVFFATHFAELAQGMAHVLGVVNRHLQTQTAQTARYFNAVDAADACARAPDDVPVMTMLFRVADGAETEPSYGITLARAIGFPATFLARAETVAAELRERAAAMRDAGDARELVEARRRKLVANVDRQLRLAHGSTDSDDEQLRAYLKRVYDDFWAQMLDGESDSESESESETAPGTKRTADSDPEEMAVKRLRRAPSETCSLEDEDEDDEDEDEEDEDDEKVRKDTATT